MLFVHIEIPSFGPPIIMSNNVSIHSCGPQEILHFVNVGKFGDLIMALTCVSSGMNLLVKFVQIWHPVA